MLQPIHDAIARRDAVQALALAEAAAKEHAQFADVHHALAIARQMSGDLDGAEAALDQAIALDTADRVYVMGHGKIVFEGTPAEFAADERVKQEWLEV